MTEPPTLSLSPVLRDPSLDVALAPDATGGERGDGLREALRSRELVGPLLGDSEQLRDLRNSDKFHVESVAGDLDNVKSDWHTSLDNVKGE